MSSRPTDHERLGNGLPRHPDDGPSEHSDQSIGDSAEQTLADFEKLLSELRQPNYHFRLYVAGTSSRSALAINNVRSMCEQYLPGHYELEVIDVYQQPEATKEAQVVALPTLIKELPFPPKRFVGDMSNSERIVVGLRLRN